MLNEFSSRSTMVILAVARPSRMIRRMWKIEELPDLGWSNRSLDSVCASVAKIFRVREDEVAVLGRVGKMLGFLYPAELTVAGAIPLSSSAVAARTVRNQRAEVLNGFAQEKHWSIFELVKMGCRGLDENAIQKLMSAPILSKDGKVIGVIQVSRKGARPDAALPNFTADDLQRLEALARFVETAMPSRKREMKA
jgi:hypothetical protein